MPRRNIPPIDYAYLEKLAESGLSEKAIATSLSMTDDTMKSRKDKDPLFMQALLRGKATSQRKICEKLYELCLAGNVSAIQWFEKSRFGMGEKIISELRGGIEVEHCGTGRNTNRVAEILTALAEIGAIPKIQENHGTKIAISSEGNGSNGEAIGVPVVGRLA